MANSLKAAFRSGSIAKRVGIHKMHNPFSCNNLTTEEEQHWFDGHNSPENGRLISLYDNKQEVLNTINAVVDLKVRTHVLVGLARYVMLRDIKFYRMLLNSALDIAEDEGDAVFLRGELLKSVEPYS